MPHDHSYQVVQRIQNIYSKIWSLSVFKKSKNQILNNSIKNLKKTEGRASLANHYVCIYNLCVLLTSLRRVVNTKKKKIHSADHYNYYIINSIIVWKSYIHTHSSLQRSTCMGDRGEPIARKKRWFRFLRFEL